MYNYVYGVGNVIFEYNLVSSDEIRLLWKRKANYAIKGDFISDEDMAKLRSIAESLTEKEDSQQTQEPKKSETIPNLPIDMNMMQKIMGLMGQFNKEDYRTRLIQDLKPLLSDERKQKADEAVRFLQLMEVLPLLKGLF